MKRLILLRVVMVIGISLLAGAVVNAPRQVIDKDHIPIASVELALINDARQEEGLTLLQRSATLDKGAMDKCNDMVKYNYWSHSRAGKEWYEFVKKDYVQAGEILAEGFTNKYEQHQAWLDSPKHREEIIGNYTDFGMAICIYQDKTPLVVVHFTRS